MACGPTIPNTLRESMALKASDAATALVNKITKQHKTAKPFWSDLFEVLFKYIKDNMELRDFIPSYEIPHGTYELPDRDGVYFVEDGDRVLLPINPPVGRRIVIISYDGPHAEIEVDPDATGIDNIPGPRMLTGTDNKISLISAPGGYWYTV